MKDNLKANHNEVIGLMFSRLVVNNAAYFLKSYEEIHEMLEEEGKEVPELEFVCKL